MAEERPERCPGWKPPYSAARAAGGRRVRLQPTDRDARRGLRCLPGYLSDGQRGAVLRTRDRGGAAGGGGLEDCATAAAALGSRARLDLSAYVTPDLRPLQAFPKLSELVVQPETVDPETCPTGPGVSPPIEAVCGPLHAARLADKPMPDAFSQACEGRGAARKTYDVLRKAVNGRDCADTWRKLHPRAHLSLVDMGLTDLSPLAGLTELRRLYLDYNDVTDLTPLSGLARLQVLWLDDNALADLSPVANMPHLLWLQAGDNPLSDLSPLADLVHMRRLWLGGDQVRDLAPVAGLTRMHKLHLAVNEIEDLSPLSGMTRLETVYLAHNRIQDATPLAGMSRLSLLSAGLDEEEDALQADRWFLAATRWTRSAARRAAAAAAFAPVGPASPGGLPSDAHSKKPRHRAGPRAGPGGSGPWPRPAGARRRPVREGLGAAAGQ